MVEINGIPFGMRMTPYDPSIIENFDYKKFTFINKLLRFGTTFYCTALHGLTHWGRDEMDAIAQTTFSSAFFLKKMFEFRL